MQEKTVMRIVYTIFLGLLIAVFVGVGINTFYESPQEPDYRSVVTEDGKNEALIQKQQTAYDSQYRSYQEVFSVYNRNVSMIVLLIAVVLVGTSLYLDTRTPVIANGVMLGGLFILLYGVVRSFMSGDSKYIFAVTTVGLALVLYLGYRRFSAASSNT